MASKVAGARTPATAKAASNGVSLMEAYCIEDYVEPGETFSMCYTLANNSYTTTLQSCSARYYIDGELVKTAEKTGLALRRGRSVEITETLTMPDGLTSGPKVVKVEVTALDGTAVASAMAETTQTSVAVPSDYRQRDKYLLELFTSTSCTNCPRGHAFVDYMMERHPEYLLAEIHLNVPGTDPFTTPAATNLVNWFAVSGTPSLSLNRININEEATVNPGFDASAYATVEKTYAGVVRDYSLPCFIELDVEACVVDDGKNIAIRVRGEGGEYARELLSEHALTVYVLEDGQPAEQAAQGLIVHNNVLRATATGPVGSKIVWTDSSSFTHEYVVPVGAKWRTAKMSVIAFVNGISDIPYLRQVMTATRVPVASEADGVVTPVAGDSAAPETYDLMGRRVTAAGSGVFVVGGRKMIR